MTPDEWDTSNNPQDMLVAVHGLASDRKLRLFACGCCDRVAHLLGKALVRSALETAARFADGLATAIARREARKMAQRGAQPSAVVTAPTSPKWERRAASAVYHATARDAGETAWNAWGTAIESLVLREGGYGQPNAGDISLAERRAQTALLRDIVPNPFRPIAFDPRLRTADAVGLATAIYEDRAFDRLPVLADALMDAACDDERVLGHCRSGRPHVRGCHVVDLVLGKD